MFVGSTISIYIIHTADQKIETKHIGAMLSVRGDEDDFTMGDFAHAK